MISQRLRHGEPMNRTHEMLISLLRGPRPRFNDKYPESHLMINLLEVSGEPREPPLMSCPAKHQKATEGHTVQPQGAATLTCEVRMQTPALTSTWIL